MVVSVVADFQNISTSILVGFRIRSRSKKFIRPLFSCAGLNFIYVFVHLVHTHGDKVRCIILESYIIKTPSM
jgi:hypothetical protein